MKRISILIAALSLLLILPITALAEGETAEPFVSPSPTPSPTGEEEPDTATRFEIDNENVYEDMAKAFKDGYIPTVRDDIAIIVLPLIADGEILDDAITVTPDLGGTSSPFVYKNYQKTIALANNAVAGGGTVSSYLVRFDLPLTAGRYNGVYPVTINVAAQNTDGSPIQQTFTTYVTITDGKDPNAPEPTEKPETPVSQPKIIISRYRIDPSPVTAGEEMTATITLKNTSGTQSVQNMTVAVSCESPNLVLKNATGVFFIDKLKKGETTDIKVKYGTDLETPAGRYNIMLNIEYDSSDAQPMSGSGAVPVTISQPLRVEMETPQIPESVNAGDTVPLSFQVMNMGRSAVYNVRIELDAPGLIPSETAFIGNMEPGTAMPGEMDVFVGTKNMSEGYEGEEKYGYTNGTVTLIYEDEAGNAYTEEIEISTTINEPVIAVSADNDEEEQETAGQWWISIVIGGVVVAGLVAYIIIRKKRREQSDEDI